jgi:hypothetical protein
MVLLWAIALAIFPAAKAILLEKLYILKVSSKSLLTHSKTSLEGSELHLYGFLEQAIHI